MRTWIMTIKCLIFLLAIPLLSQAESVLPVPEKSITYLVLAETVEPLMLASEDDPMQGGIVTDVLKQIFANSDRKISPLVVPWQRIAMERRERDDWIMYGIPSRCDPDNCALSTEPIVEFEHVIVTLQDASPTIRNHRDLFGQKLLLVENFHYPGLDQYLTTPVDAEGSGEIVDIRAYSPAGALRMLRHRRGVAYIDWRLRVLYNLSRAGLERNQVHLTSASSLIPSQNIHFFYSRKLPLEQRDLIDERLEIMRQNGVLQSIIDRYGGQL